MAYKLWGVAYLQGSCPECGLERPSDRPDFWYDRDQCPFCRADLTREAFGFHYWVTVEDLDEGEILRVRTDQKDEWTQEQRDIVEHLKWGSRIPGQSKRIYRTIITP